MYWLPSTPALPIANSSSVVLLVYAIYHQCNYHSFLVAMQTEFFLTSLSNHVPSRNQVISFPLTTPFYSSGLCRGKGPLNNFSFGLVFIICLIKFLFCIFCVLLLSRLYSINNLCNYNCILFRDIYYFLAQ